MVAVSTALVAMTAAPWAATAAPMSAGAASPAIAAGPARFVEAVYQDFLGRAPDPTKRSEWVDRLAHGTSRRSFAASMAQSAEWNRSIVGHAFGVVLKRRPSPLENEHWIGELRAHRAQVPDLLAALYGSSEHFAKLGSRSSTWIDRVYVDLVHRAPTDTERSASGDRLRSTTRAAEAMRLIRTGEATAYRVDALYHRLLRRSAEPSALWHWSARLGTGNDQQLAAELAASTEYDNLSQRRVIYGTSAVSVTMQGATAPDRTLSSVVSGDGNTIVFESAAHEIVPEDHNRWDIYAYDRLTASSTRVSVSSDGTQGDSTSAEPSVSTLGRFVAFSSYSTNLVVGDTNRARDVFLRDRQAGTTTQISQAADGTDANGGSYMPAISGDGRYIAYVSTATNLVAGDSRYVAQVLVYDRVSGVTTRVSAASDGTIADDSSYAPSISGDGRYITFGSRASNLVTGDPNWSDVFLRDQVAGTTTKVSAPTFAMYGYGSSISADGRFIVSAGARLVTETEGRPAILVTDRQLGETSVVATGPESAESLELPRISRGGRYVTFETRGSNVVPGDTNAAPDVFVTDRVTGTIRRVSVGFDGRETATRPTQASHGPTISDDGRFIAYYSSGSNLVPGDDNWAP
ncbi:MAG: domain protein beta Propeller, partial [Acidimicrobiales bacterium]|nr:domain protein beta Propeller [Acidimicrobiales bacterium]